jgi:spore coat protein H
MDGTVRTLSRSMVCWGALCAVVLLGCAGDRRSGAAGAEGIAGDGFDSFRPDRLLEVDIQMDQNDWESLRWQGRSLPRAYSGCLEFGGYSYFDAAVAIDGERVEQVSVRKKGFLGSLSAMRPSLKLNFGRGQTHQKRTFHGQKRFTLNNDIEDPSNVRQCLAYGLFAQAGIQAPRCSLAHVTAQGKNLGIYTHVEPIKKPFLKRAFGDDGGNLYEGRVSDFNSGLVRSFELKTNERKHDRSDLQTVLRALAVTDDELWDALDAVIDMDEFLTFWAMEVLVGHTDGYAANQNNYYLYFAPGDGRFHFIPWGTDSAFTTAHVEQSGTTPVSTFGGSELTARLWNIAEIRERYLERLRDLMDDLWDESELDAEVDWIGKLTGAPTNQLNAIKQFIDQRQGYIEAELGGTVPAWPGRPRTDPAVCRDPAATSGTFELSWTDAHTYAAGGKLTFEIPIAGKPLQVDADVLSAAGPVQELDDPANGSPRIAFTGTDAAAGRKYWVGLYVPMLAWVAGEIPFHGYETYGLVIELLPNGGHKRLGVIGGGAITLDHAGRTDGALVKGRWEGLVATTR